MTNTNDAERNAIEWTAAAFREYNGWTNYPTWNVFLWLSNDESDWDEFLAFGQTHPTVFDVAAYIKRYISNGDRNASARVDIQGWARSYHKGLLAAYGVIDYESIREHLMDAVQDAI